MANKKVPDQDGQESYLTGDQSDKSSTTSSRNLEKIGQDESYSVVTEESQAPGADSIDEADEFTDLMDEEEIAEEGLDTTADERKDGVTMSDDDEVEIVMGTEADVTKEDLELLGDKDQDLDGGDDEDFNRVSLDSTDEDGDLLNEASENMSATGDDLDVPEEEDAGSEDAVNEDEENQYFSLGSDANDDVTEGTP
ncbi:MAG: hypothetical protein ABWZ25_11165 [Chitinophagaceae bacterium]